MDVYDVGHLPAAVQRRSMAMTGVIPLPAVTNSNFGGGGSGRANSPSTSPSVTTEPGACVEAGIVRRLRRRSLDGDRQLAVGPGRVAAQEYARQCRLPCDVESDTQVLAGVRALANGSPV